MTHPVLKMQEAGFSQNQVDAITDYLNNTAASKVEFTEIMGELKLHRWILGSLTAIGLANMYMIFKIFQSLPHV